MRECQLLALNSLIRLVQALVKCIALHVTVKLILWLVLLHLSVDRTTHRHW